MIGLLVPIMLIPPSRDHCVTLFGRAERLMVYGPGALNVRRLAPTTGLPRQPWNLILSFLFFVPLTRALEDHERTCRGSATCACGHPVRPAR